VEWDFSQSPVVHLLGTAHYHGHDGMWEWWREWGEVWTEYDDVCQELIGAGDQVISVVSSQGRGRASGAEVKWTHFGVWTIRDEKVTRVEWFGTREEALEAVGLRE
jgi:ketosteroid isomerase-like protein